MQKSNEVTYFKQAKPVWAEGREYEKNLTMGFRAIFNKPEHCTVSFRVAASSIYRFFVNGIFFGCGPARGPHGFYRVDEWELTDKLKEGTNIVAIEVAGYNVNSYYLLDQPSFLQAELADGDNIIAATECNSTDFEAVHIKERLQKVQRYSFQRTFVEAYRIGQDFDSWKKDETVIFEKAKLCETLPKNLIARRIAYPELDVRNPLYEVAEGTVVKLDKAREYWRDRALVNISPKFKGYAENELESIVSYELDEIETQTLIEKTTEYNKSGVTVIGTGQFKIFNMGNEYSGFLGFDLECNENTLLYATFDEILIDGDIDYKRLVCVNGIKYEMKPGTYHLETIEPYSLKYLKLIVIVGQVSITDIFLREYSRAKIKEAGFKCSNDKLNRVFEAGVETFRQNALDVFMDCPSRERAGWLCDSFFTSRVEYDLTGKSLIEKNFLENYLLPDKFEFLPEGMLPMCYPADHNDGVFIPNWALWFVVQLEEYFVRTADREIVDKFKEKVYKLFEYFKKFKNEYGLLENLENWVFVEWSKANELIQNVNYPSNMLYAYAMEAAGRLFKDIGMLEEAVSLRKTILEQAYDGKFFVDNAIREDGHLRVTENTTEVCQYYAFYFNIATPETHAELWKTLVEKFGPKRKDTGLFPEVYPANAFIGNYLRLEILSRYGHSDKVIDNIEGYFDYMAEKTGTLWENVDTSASCNHGFASHVVHCFYRDALGILNIDKEDKKIFIRNSDNIKIDWCEGWMPLDDSRIFIRWHKENGSAVYETEVPPGYELQMIK